MLITAVTHTEYHQVKIRFKGKSILQFAAVSELEKDCLFI